MGLETGTYIDDFVVTNPLGTDDRSTADDHLRLIKDLILNTFPNLAAAMTATAAELNRMDGITASTAELNIMDGVTANATELSLLAGKVLLSSDNVIDNLPAGTLMTFQQTAAPTGWVKQTTHNNKAFRVVSGAAGSGGTDPFSTVFGLQATDGYGLQEADIPQHNHGAAGDHVHTITTATGTNDSNNGWDIQVKVNKSAGSTTSQYFGTAGDHTHSNYGQASPNAHTHNIDLRVQFVDLIIASKT